MSRRPPISTRTDTLVPDSTCFRSPGWAVVAVGEGGEAEAAVSPAAAPLLDVEPVAIPNRARNPSPAADAPARATPPRPAAAPPKPDCPEADRKSTRLNASH